MMKLWDTTTHAPFPTLKDFLVNCHYLTPEAKQLVAIFSRTTATTGAGLFGLVRVARKGKADGSRGLRRAFAEEGEDGEFEVSRYYVV